MATKLISFICPSRNLNIIKSFLDNIEVTVKHPEVVECLFKLDEDQVEAKPFIEAEIAKRPFTIKYILTPRLNGVSATGVACNDLFTIFKPDSYFIQVISDEVRFETIHWDEILKKYIGYFPDHVFRLRMSQFKLRTCPDLFNCNQIPDSFPIYTKQWLYLALGLGTHCWASDIINQFIAHHLSLGEQGYKYYNTPFYDTGINRDVQLLDIKFEGLEFGVGVSAEIQKNRGLWVTQLWNKNMSHYHQEHFSYVAKRISSYIWARANNLERFTLYQNKLKKTVQVIDVNGVLHREVSYRLPRINFFCTNMLRKAKVAAVEAKVWGERIYIPPINRVFEKINSVLNKLYPYKELCFTRFLQNRKSLSFMKPVFDDIVRLNNAMPVAKHGRAQKNIIIYFVTARALLNNMLDAIQRVLVGPPPGISDKKRFLGMFGGSRWPKALIPISGKDHQWAQEAIKKQNETYQQMANAMLVVDEDGFKFKTDNNGATYSDMHPLVFERTP